MKTLPVSVAVIIGVLALVLPHIRVCGACGLCFGLRAGSHGDRAHCRAGSGTPAWVASVTSLRGATPR